MGFSFSPLCCCGGSECQGCLAGTAPQQWQVTIANVVAGTSPPCCADCGGFNNTFTLDFFWSGPYAGHPACYWSLETTNCSTISTDRIFVILHNSSGNSNAKLVVQVFGSAPPCPMAPQPLFQETRDLGSTLVNCAEVDESFTYTRAPVLGDTAVCNFKSATITVTAV